MFPSPSVLVSSTQPTPTAGRERISTAIPAHSTWLLNEPATVRYSLKGPSRRTVKLGRIQPGTHAFTLRRLKRGKYRGVLTVVDNFDKKITPRNSFVVR